MKDLLEQLAEMDVAPSPPEFDRQLHQRLNRSLIAQHLLDFTMGAVPWALWHFFCAVAGMIAFSMSGKYAGGDRKSAEDGR